MSGGPDLHARHPARRHQPGPEHPALAPGDRLAAGRVPRGVPPARPAGARGRARRCAKLRRYAPIHLDRRRHPRPRPPAAARRGCSRGARPGGRAPGSRARPPPTAPRSRPTRRRCARQGFFDADAPPPDRMLVKALNYNLAFVPDLLRALPGRALRRGDPRRAGGLRGPRRPRRQRRGGGRGLRLRRRAADRARGRRPAAQDLALRGSARRRRRRQRGEVYDFCGLDPAATRGVCLQDKERISTAGGGSPACARSRSSTASRRWAGTCAPTPTPARSRGCPRRRGPRSPRAAARCSAFRLRRGATEAAALPQTGRPRPPPATGAMTRRHAPRLLAKRSHLAYRGGRGGAQSGPRPAERARRPASLSRAVGFRIA